MGGVRRSFLLVRQDERTKKNHVHHIENTTSQSSRHAEMCVSIPRFAAKKQDRCTAFRRKKNRTLLVAIVQQYVNNRVKTKRSKEDCRKCT